MGHLLGTPENLLVALRGILYRVEDSSYRVATTWAAQGNASIG